MEKFDKDDLWPMALVWILTLILMIALAIHKAAIGPYG